MRITSTLHPPTEFKLTGAEMKEGFAALYLGRFQGQAYDLAMLMFLHLAFPWTRVITDLGPWKNWSELAAMILKKDKKDAYARAVTSVLARNTSTKSFNFVVPHGAVITNEDMLIGTQGNILNFIGSKLAPQQRLQLAQQYISGPFEPISYTGVEVAKIVNTTPRNKAILAKAIAHAMVMMDKGELKVMIQYNIPKEVAEYINSTPFLEIKLGNFYQLLIDWVASVFTADGRVAEFSTPITRISQSIKVPGVKAVVRTDKDNMIVSDDGLPYWIPQIDQSAMYEQLLQDYGMQEDGSYTMAPTYESASAADFQVGEEEPKIDINAPVKKLPANMPILVDWVNGKFSYSNSAGRLDVMDLETSMPLKPMHIKEVLEKEVDQYNELEGFGIIGTALLYAIGVGFNIDKFQPLPQELNDDAKTYYEKRGVNGSLKTRLQATFAAALVPPGEEDKDGIDYRDFIPSKGITRVLPLYEFNSRTTIRPLAWIGRMIEAAAKFLESNVEAAYKRYSVTNIMQSVAALKIFAQYAHTFKEVAEQDAKDRHAYLNQGLDKNYQVQALPMIRHYPDDPEKCLKLLPHQLNTENMLRESPDNGVLDADAGAGKTIMILKDILKDLQKGKIKKPVVLCPAALVSQYVTEVVFLTEGRMNIIPFTNVSMKQHGQEGLRKMIEKAPINTVCVVDFQYFLKARPQNVAYGNKSLQLFRNVEFLREFNFDAVYVDESHYLKNTGSIMTKAAQKFVMDIPVKRIASGTLVHNVLTDLVAQFNLFDPTVFGSRSKFVQDYAAEATKSGKIISYKAGAEVAIKERMRGQAVFCSSRRKEWASLLPKLYERVIPVDMTDHQKDLYASILQDVTERIKEAMEKNKELAELMESDDDSKAEQLEAMLKRHMFRLEQFLSSPAEDVMGDSILTDPEDRVSPKVAKVHEIIREHLDNNIPGKILVFTNYNRTVDAIYDYAPPDMQKQMIRYIAEDKMECRAMFEDDPKMKIMVGISESLQTGLNLQHASRLIRVETLWTPGGLEQGNSRINRPQLKKTEERANIYFDWIVVNNSVDITKMARLTAKLISKAKFDESDSPAFQAIDPNNDLRPIPMSLESISKQNDFATNLHPYLLGYQELQRVQEASYREYREAHPNLKIEIVPKAPMLPGSKLLSRVPYIPGMDIYGTEKLGLVRYDEYLRKDAAAVLDDDEEDDEDENDLPEVNAEGEVLTLKQLKKLKMKKIGREETLKMKGFPIHTDRGDGTITQVTGPRRVRVRLASGEMIWPDKIQTFVITRPTTNSRDLRTQLLKQVGEVPLDKPTEVPIEPTEVMVKRKQLAERGVKAEKDLAPQKDKKDEQPQVEFQFQIINDHLALQAMEVDDSEFAILSNFGFKISPTYWYTKVKGPITLHALFATWRKKGFKFDKQTTTSFGDLYNAMKTQGRQVLGQFGLAKQLDLHNYYTRPFKPSTDPKLIHPFPMLQGGFLYVGLMTKAQAGTKNAIKVSVPNIKWMPGGGEDELMMFFQRKEQALEKLKELHQSGIVITNANELKEAYRKLKLVPRNPKSKNEI